MLILIYVAGFGFAAAVAYSICDIYGKRAGSVYEHYKRRRTGVFLLVSPLLEALTRFNKAHIPEEHWYLHMLREKMRMAGMLGRYNPYEFVAFQELAGFGAMLAGLIAVLFPGAGIQESPPTAIAFMLVLGICAAMLPLMPIDNTAAARKREIMRHWPFFLDLLTIAVQSGIDMTISIRRIIEHSALNPLTEELGQFINEINLGKSRAEALHDLSQRINVPMVTAVLDMIAEAEQLGTPLAPALRIQALEFRQKQAANVEKKAMEAPVKMMLPLLTCIFPAILIVLVGPVMIQYFSAN